MQNQEKRVVGIWLAVGIIFMPILFVWFLMRDGHTTTSRILGFLWASFIIFLLYGVDNSTEIKETAKVEANNIVAKNESVQTESTLVSPMPQAVSVVGQQWNYSVTDDPMSNGKTYHASVSSSNTVNFEFPYSGEQSGTLTLRSDPKTGKDVIFNIEKGQILCHSYEDCNVLVRFDDEKASNFSAVGPADNSSETIFFRNYSRFVEKMSKAKKVRISLNIYQEGSPVFEFDVSGFDKQKFKPKS